MSYEDFIHVSLMTSGEHFQVEIIVQCIDPVEQWGGSIEPNTTNKLGGMNAQDNCRLFV